MRRFGLIGYPLSHSFSKKYFTEKFEQEEITECQYDLFPLKTIDELPFLLREYPELEGLKLYHTKNRFFLFLTRQISPEGWMPVIASI